MSSAGIGQEVAAHLTSRHLPPTSEWLASFLPSVRPNTPINALKQTALFRILASDITRSVRQGASPAFPVNIHDGTIRERKLTGTIVVQVLDIEDIGTSRWSQVEALEAEERGESIKGREIIRVVAEDSPQSSDEPIPHQQNASGRGRPTRSGPHKLLLQDVQGTKVYAFELKPIDKVDLDIPIGTKLILNNVLVARGVVMMEPQCVEIMGGKIEELNKTWKEGKKQRLKAAAGIVEPDRSGSS